MSTLMVDTLRGIFSDVLEIEPSSVGPDLSPNTCAEWDSVRNVSLVLSIEERFGFMLDEEDLPRLTSFQAVCDFIEKKLSA